MTCSRCGKCCRGTEMELSGKDMRRLEKAGHRREDFSVIGEDGVTRLRNVGVWCFFHDVSQKSCRVYADRPLGCYLYPVTYSVDDNVIIVDDQCPMGETLSKHELSVKGRILMQLLKTIDDEVETRQFRKNAGYAGKK